MAWKGWCDRSEAMIGQIGVVLHQLASLLGVIELIVLCAFVRKSRRFQCSNQGDSTTQVGVWLTCLSKKM